MSGESQIIEQFRTLAGAGDKDDFGLSVGPISIRAKYYGGSSSSLILSAPYTKRSPDPVAPAQNSAYRQGASGVPTAARPLSITCRTEDSGDQAGKESGVTIEAQTGDIDFDKAVFLDSPSSADVVRYVLADKRVRDAVRLLLEYGFENVEIDDDRGMITARISSFPGGDPIPERAQILAQAFADIVRHVGFVEASGESHKGSFAKTFIAFLAFLAIAGLTVGPIAFFNGAPPRCLHSDGEGSSLMCAVSGCCSGAALGLAAGILIGPLLAYLFMRPIRGTSRAHTQRAWVAVLTVIVSLQIAILAGSFVGWYR